MAAAVAMALLAAPLAALVHFVPGWSATNDPALMGLRALDVGTSSTLLVGQPSQAGLYAEVTNLHHPGPSHLYLLALPVRMLGADLGMPLVSVLIVGSCLLVSAWVVYRLLGTRAALVAAAGLGLVTLTTGAASLINPVSSNIAGYPLLATAALMWAVATGDVRLLPPAALAASFTAQQHLAVVPATLVIVAGGLGVGAALWWRDGRWRDAASRRELRRPAALSVAVAAVMWAPVLAQQAFGDEGNLGQMLWFARHGNGETLGMASALRQVAHAVGLPPLLGRTDATGGAMLEAPSVLTWASAAGALAGVAGLTVRRRDDRPRLALGAMVGVVVLAGLVNGSSVPEGVEMLRMPFYHWAFVLAFLVAVVLGLAATELPVPRLAVRGVGRVAAVAVVCVVTATAGIVSPALDRRHNTAAAAYSSAPSAAMDRLADVVVDHDGAIGEHTLLMSRGEPPFAGIAEGVALELAERGVDVEVPLSWRFFVADRRLVDRDRVDGAVVLVVEQLEPRVPPPGGELLGRVDLADRFPHAALARLVRAAEAAEGVDLGPGAQAHLARLPEAEARLLRPALRSLASDPGQLTNEAVLDAILAAPPVSPEFDPDDVRAVAGAVDRLADDDAAGDATAVSAYLLDRGEILDYATAREIGRPPEDDDPG